MTFSFLTSGASLKGGRKTQDGCGVSVSRQETCCVRFDLSEMLFEELEGVSTPG